MSPGENPYLKAARISSERPRLKVTMKIEAIDPLTLEPLTETSWVTGMAKINNGERFLWEIEWIADSYGIYYTVTGEEPR